MRLTRSVQEELSKAEQHSAELQRQNTLLHQQVQALSSTMAASLQRTPSEGPLCGALAEEDRSQDQVLEILR